MMYGSDAIGSRSSIACAASRPPWASWWVRRSRSSRSSSSARPSAWRCCSAVARSRSCGSWGRRTASFAGHSCSRAPSRGCWVAWSQSVSDEIANIESQKQSTNRIVNELDRQITGLGGQIDLITVDLLIAQDALLEKRAVLERRLVDIYKRGALYSWQVLLAAESFGDLLSRYKYLYLVSRQDRLLTNDMHKLRDRVARQRQLLVDARETLGRRRHDRTDELDRYLTLERERETNLRETRRNARQAEQRLTRLDRDEKSLNDRIDALERARRDAEARGVTATTGSISTADLGGLDWPVARPIIYLFGTTPGPDHARTPR